MPEGPPRFTSENAPQRTIRQPIGWPLRWPVRSPVATLITVVAFASLPTAAPAGEPAPEARYLVIVLDAVPYESALEFTRREGGEPPLLADLNGPVPLISTFPSSTSVALTAILSRFDLDIPPGYENKFFDREVGKVRGGTLGSYGKIRFDWHHFFDWQLRGFFTKSRAYAKPLKYNRREIDRAFEAFTVAGDRTRADKVQLSFD